MSRNDTKFHVDFFGDNARKIKATIELTGTPAVKLVETYMSKAINEMLKDAVRNSPYSKSVPILYKHGLLKYTDVIDSYLSKLEHENGGNADE